MDAIDHYLAANRARIGEGLRALIGDGARPPAGGALMVALARPLAESGLLLQSPMRAGRPLVAAGGEPGARSVLLLFHSDPTEADDEPGGGRAALVAALVALAALRATGERLPLAVTLVCEADRAAGSAGLAALAPAAADYCLWDGGDWGATGPRVALGSHGLARLRLRAVGPGGPAGLGALVANPAWRLTWALAALKTPSEEIGAAGVYEPVREPRPEELAALALTVPDLERTVTHGGGQALLGLRGESLPLVRAFSPSLSITGWGVEATRPGFLPAAAWAELTATLVPRQTPAELLAGIEAALRARDLADVTVELVAGYPGAETPADAPLVALARRLVEEHLGSPVLLPFAAHPAPLARLAGAPAAIGLGPGRAPWPILEERVVALARLLAALLHHL